MSAVQSSSRRGTPKPQAQQQQLRPTTRSMAPAASRHLQRPIPRTTRGQSREPSETAATQPVGRSTRARSRQASVESASNDVSSTAPPARPRQRKGRVVGAGDLTTVQEDPPAHPIQGLQDDEGNHQSVLPAESLDNTQHSPGGFSNVSGTTAVTSFSAADAADLDQDDLLHYLPILHRESEGILNVVAPDQATEASLQLIINEIRKPGTKTGKTLNKRETSFALPLDTFGGNDSIRPEVILRSLFPTRPVRDLEPGAWRPDEILHKANLALLARDIVSVEERESPDAWNVVRRLDSIFPSPFLTSVLSGASTSTLGGSALLEATFNLALEIRTQLAILLPIMAQDPTTFNMDETLAEIFFEPMGEEDSRPVDLKSAIRDGRIRGWGTKGLESEDIQENVKFRQAVRQRVIKIKDSLPIERRADNNAIDLERLLSEFPWSSFVVQVLRWVRQRNREIEEKIRGKGGVDSISKLLENEVRAYRDSSSLMNPPTAPAASTATPRRATQQNRRTVEANTPGSHSTSLSKSARKAISSPYFIQHTDMLKKLERRVSGPFAPSVAAAAAQEQVQEPTHQPVADDLIHGQSGQDGAARDDDRRTVHDDEANAGEHQASVARRPISSSARDVFGKVQRARKINKENLRTQATTAPKRHFTDPQKTAQRVEWDDNVEPTQASQGMNDRPTVSSGAKRARPDETEELGDYEASEDEGFQYDKRPVDTAQRRRDAPPAKRRAFVQVPLASSNDRRMAAHAPRTTRGSAAFDSSGSDGEPVPSRARDWARRYEVVSSTAKAFSAARNPHTPRERHPWTEDEEAALISGIGEHGCRYALIKQQDLAGEGFLERRTQVDLKDKARNMRLNYIKAGTGMPRNFEQVPLRRRDWEQLEAMGLDI